MIARRHEDAVTPTISVILLVLLVALISIIIYAFIYGIPGGLEKSAFIAAEAGVVEINGTEYITIRHRGGDSVFLNGSGATRGIPIDIRTTAASGGPVLAGANAPITWSPGQVLYLYNTAEGPKITIDRLTAAEGTGFPAGQLEIVIIDTKAEVRIFGSTFTMAGSGPGPDDLPVAGFTADPYSGLSPLFGQFTDTSLGVIESWLWDFGDGNNATAQNPSHTFAHPGTYTVTLTVANSGGSDGFSREIVVAPEINGFTVEAWVKWNRDPAPPDGTHNFATIVVDGSNNDNSPYHLQHNSDNSLFEIAIRTDQHRRFRWSSTSPVECIWYHVVGVYNQDNEWLRIFVNGGPHENSISQQGTIINSSGLYQVGGIEGITFFTNNQRKFDGEIRGLGTYERAFTQAEIQARYDAGVPLS
ncbi:MAG: LamG-like jellyroll fold domain-containing protein, partial [Methanocalculus sp.]|uniref:PKD domain-containing protein n=1 Tax=Methanocalculus sp. TaxID=2004547 RepID=UPI00271DBF97